MPPPNSTILQKGQENYPTPTVENKLVVEYAPMEVGSYELLEYGSLWQSISHASFARDYANYILVAQQPAFDNNSWFMRRVWCAPWVGQSDWDYSFTYLEQDPDYPIVTRIDTVLREGYAPSPALTPDVAYPGALLTEERMINQTDPPDMHSKFVQVVKVFTTLPGPIVSTQDMDENLNAMVTTERQQVLATDEFDPTSPALHLNTLSLREQPLSKYVKIRIWSYLPVLPDPFDSYKTGRYNFPALVFDIVLTVLQWTLDPNRSQVAWYPDMRAEPQVPAIFRITTEYYTAEPAPVTLYTIPSANLIYNGTSYNISIGSVLNDEITVSADFTDDAQYGDLSEGITFPATDLSATEYMGDIGTFQDVGCDITRFRCAIYVRQTTAVELV